MWGDIALIFVFILIGGTFAAAEMAMVTLRESQVKQLATKGKRGRAIARLTSRCARWRLTPSSAAIWSCVMPAT